MSSTDVDTAPTMSRHHASGAESARGVLFTILGEFVLPAGGVAWTSAFLELFARVGIEARAGRQALTRTAADGWLSPERIGRRTRWRLTPSAEKLLSEGAERIYGFGAHQADWDGNWLLVLARVPESDRPARHLLRTRLAWAGFGTPSAGLWVSTHAARAAEAEQVLAQAGALDGARLFLARQCGSADPARMAADAWDLESLDAAYRRFVDDFGSARADDPLRSLLELVHAWRRFPWLDPALPREFLPRRWAGCRAATLFAKRRAQWSAAAAAEWSELQRI